MQQFVENAWLLHSRKYTDTRILVELLCEKHGLISGVYRVPSKAQPPQMFRLLTICWKGKQDLKSILSIESNNTSDFSDSSSSSISNWEINLHGIALYCGFYLNELLVRLLAKDDPHIDIFRAYAKTLAELRASEALEPALRKFEFHLLEQLGYGIDFSVDANGQAIENSDAEFYKYELESGFVKVVLNNGNADSKGVFSGQALKGLAQADYADPRVRRLAKQLGRQCLDRLLGGKALKSRELFRSE